MISLLVSLLHTKHDSINYTRTLTLGSRVWSYRPLDSGLRRLTAIDGRCAIIE